MYAIIRAGGQQYRVAQGDEITIDRQGVEPGQTLSFAPLLLVDGESVKATPADLDGFQVTAEVVEHGKGRKIKVFNYHSKTGWKKMKGHRSYQTTVRITGIG